MDAREKEQYLREYSALKAKGKPFFPYAVGKDSLMAVIVLIVIILMSLILGAELISGAQAQALGVVQWALPGDELAAWTAALAQRLSAMPKAALAANKRCIAAQSDPARDGYAEELAATRALYQHPETRQKVTAFLARNTRRTNP